MYIRIFHPTEIKKKNDTFTQIVDEEAKYSQQLALCIGIWIQLGILGVIYLFLILVLMASLLATELENNISEEELDNSRLTDINDQFFPSQILEKWMKCYDLFNRFVEGINSCFGPILLLTICHVFVMTTYYWNGFQFSLYNTTSKWAFESFVKYNLLKLSLLYFRLLIIVVGCYYLKVKVGR